MKNLSSPSPTKSSGISRVSSSSELQQRFCSPKRSREANENEQEFHNQPSLKLQKPKKMATKHFMSPTVSAASKAVVPRKKILAERNEASGLISPDTQDHVNPINDPNDAPEDLAFDGLGAYSSQTTPLSSRVSELDSDIPDPLSQPYDPFTNYLSPRPKFLRYNPNRRIEILHRRENELTKQGDELGFNPIASLESQKLVEELALSQAYDSLSSSLEDSSIKQDGSSPNADKLNPRPSFNGENNECNNSSSEENMEEVEEEKPLSQSDDSSSTSPLGDGSSPSPNIMGPRPINNAEIKDSEEENEEDEAEVKEEGGHWCLNGVLKLLLLLVLYLSISYMSAMSSSTSIHPKASWNLNRTSQASMNDFLVSDIFLNTKQEQHQSSTEAADITDINEGLEDEEMDELQMEKPTGIFNQIDAMLGLPDEVNGKKFTEMAAKSDAEESMENLAAELGSEHCQASDDAAQSEKPEVVSWNLNQVPSNNVPGHEAEDIEGPGAELTSDSCQVRDEALKLKKPEVAFWNLNQVPTERVTNEWIGREVMAGDQLEESADVNNGLLETFEQQGTGIEDVYEPHESLKLPLNEFTLNEIEDRTTRFKNLSSEMEVLDAKSTRAHSMSKVLAMMGISFLSIIAVSAALRFLYPKRKKPLVKEPSPTTRQSQQSKGVEPKISPLPMKIDGIEKAESNVNPWSSNHAEGRGPLQLHGSQTPTVDLGGQFSSSLKKHNQESSPTESKASSYSWSQEKRPRRKGVSSANHEYSTVSDLSAIQSPSYGSFTAQEKITIKEEGIDGEGSMKVVTTPVRRSSRIANRAVMSP